nr:MAG TPA: hypothetical protein [Caudoviricetes sp.]
MGKNQIKIFKKHRLSRLVIRYCYNPHSSY